MSKQFIPKAILPSSQRLLRLSSAYMPHPDFKYVKLFMLSYAHSADTYNATEEMWSGLSVVMVCSEEKLN